jgi:hypothetical protein
MAYTPTFFGFQPDKTVCPAVFSGKAKAYPGITPHRLRIL